TYLEGQVFQLEAVPFPVSGNVLVFILINLNVILLLLMVFLTMRNLVELVFDRRRRILGTSLRTKLVISFVSLSLIPTTLLFFVSLQFVSTSMDYWFNSNVDRSLNVSLELAQEVYQEVKDQLKKDGVLLASVLTQETEGKDLRDQISYLRAQLKTFMLTGLTIYSSDRQRVVDLMNDQSSAPLPILSAELLRRGLSGEVELSDSLAVHSGEVVRTLTQFSQNEEHYLLVTSRLIPAERLAKLSTISKGIQGYRQLLLLKNPLKTSILVVLLIVTLLIIFSAIWFGFYVSSGLTRPMAQLSEGLKRVADGELDFVLEKSSADEMGMLVDSFNRMTRDLLSSTRQVAEAHQALRQVNDETEKRRRYTEIILQNVTAGVISLDGQGRVLTINKFAEELLRIKGEDIINKNYISILRLNHLSILEHFFDELAESGRSSIQRSIKITVNNETLSLRVNFTKLEDEENRSIGVVIVFDNLTEIEKIQRMAAWREVARRIAHEVKNPLTPIQLSAQRLRKRYLDKLAGEGEVFDQCTSTIIKQVDELKHLVSEFSSFARMPVVRKSINHLGVIVSEVLILFQEAHKEISFTFVDQGVPAFYFDAEQLKRVLVNLLDNAVAAVPVPGGAIDVEIAAHRDERLAIIEVKDNGLGINDLDKNRVFEPYFSTKKTGTGLGLAIVNTVIADHGGYIRVKDHKPQGAVFFIELPLVTVA
ncbi:MAG: PAS domain-containing protein, partial [Proteobacteria bacterium]|nr:PAS domain-containing protein [Pseudomonadota bacterium]